MRSLMIVEMQPPAQPAVPVNARFWEMIGQVSLGTLVLLVLALTGRHNYLLFHSLAEGFSIIIACGVFMVTWNARRFLDNHYFLLLGLAYLFVAGLDLLRPAYRDIIQRFGLANPCAPSLPARYELKLLTKAGQERWVDVTAGAMEYDGRPAYVVTAFDITNRDVAEQALQVARREIQAGQPSLPPRPV